MAIFTMANLPTILNLAILFFSLTLVALSTAILYLTSHGMQLMDKAFPPGKYLWYRGPWWDIDIRPKVTLRYDSVNEGVILTAAAVGCLAGLVGIIGCFITRKSTKPIFKTALFLLIPSSLTLLTSLIALIFTTVIFKTNNRGSCYWENGYGPYNVFFCTRELAACNIASYFLGTPWRALHDACGETETGRHLLAPLFVASALMCGVGIARVMVGRKEEESESAEERAERLQSEED